MIKTRPSLLIFPDKTAMYETMFHIAYAYNRSGKLVKEHSDNSNNVAFLFPSIVCQSFAIELLLKFFLYVDHPNICNQKDAEKFESSLNMKKNKIGHKFSQIWDLIPANYQQEISVHYSNAINSKSTTSQFKRLLQDIGDDSFVKWRYIYESDSHHFMHDDLTEIVSDVLLSAAHFEIKKRAKIKE